MSSSGLAREQQVGNERQAVPPRGRLLSITQRLEASAERRASRSSVPLAVRLEAAAEKRSSFLQKRCKRARELGELRRPSADGAAKRALSRLTQRLEAAAEKRSALLQKRCKRARELGEGAHVLRRRASSKDSYGDDGMELAAATLLTPAEEAATSVIQRHWRRFARTKRSTASLASAFVSRLGGVALLEALVDAAAVPWVAHVSPLEEGEEGREKESKVKDGIDGEGEGSDDGAVHRGFDAVAGIIQDAHVMRAATALLSRLETKLLLSPPQHPSHTASHEAARLRALSSLAPPAAKGKGSKGGRVGKVGNVGNVGTGGKGGKGGREGGREGLSPAGVGLSPARV